MTPTDIARVQHYLRRTFANDHLNLIVPRRQNDPVELQIDDEFIGVLHRDDDDGEASYSLYITILDIDLPPANAVAAVKKR